MSALPLIARVEPLTSTRSVRGPFDYRLRIDQGEVAVGSLLQVPFGRRLMFGVVVELTEQSELEPARLAEPTAVLPTAVPPDLVSLARWMAQEYCSTVARALALVLAPGAITGSRPRLVLVAEITAAGRAALNSRHEPDAGSRSSTDSRPPTARQFTLLADLGRRGASIAADLGTPSLRRLEARGLVSLDERELRRAPTGHAVSSTSVIPPPLSADQQRALAPVLAAIERRRGPQHGGSFLVHGVTGSGKTEIYLRAVQAVLAAGRSAIVLVPEIALTPQALARFQARFGEVIAVMHSGLGPGARHDEWLRLTRGQARVCVGPRSAVFAPLSEIGLIIVDEEHESSYKHEGDPRYDARTVAQQRATDHAAVLLVGSATPRPETVQAQRATASSPPDRWAPASACADPRHARSAPPPAPGGADGACRRAAHRWQGDRAAQPARLV